MTVVHKDGVLYKGVQRGRRRFLLVIAIYALLFILFLCACSMYITGKLHGPYPFDAEKFASTTQTVVYQEPITMKKREDKSISSYAAAPTSWLDGRRYRFLVSFDSIESTGIHYDTTIKNPETNEEETFVIQQVYMGTIGDIQVPILAPFDVQPQAGQQISGIFTEPAKVILSDLTKDVTADTPLTISQYLFDMRGIEMGTENSDPWIALFGLALLLYLAIRLARYYINPYKHPTYKQLAKYGEFFDVIEEIETQFAADDVYRDEKELVSKDWCIKNSTFYLKVYKNHRAKGRYE